MFGRLVEFLNRPDSAGVVHRRAPYHRRMTNCGSETLYYCAECRALAMAEIVEESEL